MRKKIISALLIASTIFCLTGCGTKVINVKGETVNQLGRFIILEDEERYIDFDGNTHHQFLVYDKDTYVIYIYDSVCSTLAISPFYCINADGEPEVAVYHD